VAWLGARSLQGENLMTWVFFLETFKIKSLRYWLAKCWLPYAIIYDLKCILMTLSGNIYGSEFELQNTYRMLSNVCYTYTGIQVVDFFPPNS
jgi:hypothetical protein